MPDIGFDPGPTIEPFASLVRSYPGDDVYASDEFRTEWGPVFHRGRLDGSARLLALGQDPAQHENACRRILVGMAGQRVQRFMERLGVTHSYVLFNALLFSLAPGGNASSAARDPAITAYRHRWLDALVTEQTQGVMCFGSVAQKAFKTWKQTPAGQAKHPVVAHGMHPTAAWHQRSEAGKRQAELTLVAGWNLALETLATAVTRETAGTLELYDPAEPADLAAIPAEDLPAGTPSWMRSIDEWAVRDGRATISMTVPASARAWESP